MKLMMLSFLCMQREVSVILLYLSIFYHNILDWHHIPANLLNLFHNFSISAVSML